MMRLDRAVAVQVRYSPGYLQNARISAGAQTEPVDRELEQPLARRFDLAVCAQFARAHLRIAKKRRSVKTRELKSARTIDAFADHRRRFSRAAIRELAIFHRRHLNMNIDTIQQWSRDARAIALDRQRRARALMLRVGVEAARASPRCLFAMSDFVAKNQRIFDILPQSSIRETISERHDSTAASYRSTSPE